MQDVDNCLKSYLIFGGSFDPIHNGHLCIAKTVHEILGWNKIYFIPCKQSVLKSSTHAALHDRIAMLRLGLAPYSWCQLDLREITRNSPSYMVETLDELRQELGNQVALILIIGADAFLTFTQWHCYQQILSLCHLLIIHRPNIPSITDPILQSLYMQHVTSDLKALSLAAFGYIYNLNIGEYNISSTQIRSAVLKHENLKTLVPDVVLEYIKRHKLYGFGMKSSCHPQP